MKQLLRTIAAVPFSPLRFIQPQGVARGIALLARLSTATAPAHWATKLLLILRSQIDVMVSTSATRLEGGVHPKHRLMDYHRFFWSRLRTGERVLDIGSGVGALAHDMAERGGAYVTGIELSAKNVAFARERFPHPHVQYILGDALIDLPAGPYDTVVMSNVLEHIDDRVGFLRTVQNRVHPERWLLRIPRHDREWAVPLMDELDIDSRLDATHFTEYTPESLSAELTAAGLRTVHLESRWGEFWCEAVPA